IDCRSGSPSSSASISTTSPSASASNSTTSDSTSTIPWRTTTPLSFASSSVPTVSSPCMSVPMTTVRPIQSSGLAISFPSSVAPSRWGILTPTTTAAPVMRQPLSGAAVRAPNTRGVGCYGRSSRLRCSELNRNCFAFLGFLGLDVHAGKRGTLANPAGLQGLELVEGLVHLTREVRLVARNLLQVRPLRLRRLHRGVVTRGRVERLHERLFGFHGRAVHGVRVGRAAGLHGEPAHQLAQLAHRVVDVLEEGVSWHTREALQERLGDRAYVPCIGLLARLVRRLLHGVPRGGLEDGSPVLPLHRGLGRRVEEPLDGLVDPARHLGVLDGVQRVGFYEDADVGKHLVPRPG